VFRILLEFLLALITIISGGVTLWLGVTKNQSVSISGWILGVFALIFFFESIIIKVKWGRSRLYGECLPIINSAFSNMHEVLRSQQGKEVDLREGYLVSKDLCERLADAFSLITGARCSVSIRCLSSAHGDLESFAFARSSYQCERRKYNDNESNDVEGEKIIHYIKNNTDFHEIIENIGKIEGRYFICNYLPLKKDYQNTSFKTYGAPSRFLFMRPFNWSLPYRSTLVVPICPDIADRRTADDLLGFLCVDSRRSNVFKKDYDTDLMIGMADGLYDLIEMVQETSARHC
jgi:hypothetical protein